MAVDGKTETIHHEDTRTSETPGSVAGLPEGQMGAWQCIRANPKIIFYSLYANIGAVMIGYDNLALAVCLAMPAFQNTFASDVNGTLIIPAYWQSAWNAMYNVMTLVGSLTAAESIDRFGCRFGFLFTAVVAAAGVALNFVAQNPAEFLGGKMITGFAVGIAMTVGQKYVSEIAPLPMRGIALSFNTICMNIGFLIAISATFSRVSILDESAFRHLFAAAWAFPGAIAIGLPFIPESPYWYAQRDQADKVKRALERLSPKNHPVQPQVDQIMAAIEAERTISAVSGGSGAVSLLDCFRGTNWRRTRVVLICSSMNVAVGGVLSANAPYFLNQTGLASHTVTMLIEIGISLGVLSALVNVALMARFNQRPLLLGGIGLCAAMFLIMGVAGCFARTPKNLLLIGIVLQITPLSYGPSVGAAMAVAGEVSSMSLRSKTLGVGIASNYLFSTIWLVVLPYLFNEDEANLGGKIGFIFFAQAVLFMVAVWFEVPSTNGRSYEDLDLMFESRLHTRKFQEWEQDSSAMAMAAKVADL